VSQQVVVVDACSIMNFAAVGRMSLFELAMRSRGRWTQAVAGEIRRSSGSLAFKALTALLNGGWLGEPIELDTDEDRTEVEDIRAALGGYPGNPLKHRGEAESIRAILSRAELRGAIFLTDDGDATYLASHRGITVKDTKWLVADAYSMGDMRCPEPYDVLTQMYEANRGVSLPDGHEGVCP
jgi:predicted nucleic acid-binding protein